jgi:DNA modification methylase
MSSTQPTRIATNKLKTNPNNPRTIRKDQLEKLVKSLREFPEMLEARPIVVDPDYVVLGGNMRLKAAQEAGLAEVPVYVATWEEAKHKEFIIKDNGHSGEWDQDMLANDGWDTEELKEWGVPIDWDPVQETEGLTDPDDVPAVPEEPTTKLGDLWILGDHRLLCGDSTKAEDVELLLDATKPDCVWTDPPYGMNAVSKSGVLSKNYDRDILGDDTNEVAIASFPLWEADAQFWFGANYYPECLPSSGCWVVWDKNNGGSDQADAELCWTNQKGVVRIYKQASEKRNRVHPTQKPSELVEWCFDRWKVGARVADPFSGSGVTFIACEKTNRKCYGMELDPKYCDVIVKRWENFTGKKARLQNEEETFEILTQAN